MFKRFIKNVSQLFFCLFKFVSSWSTLQFRSFTRSVRWPTSRQITMQSGFNSDDYCQYDSTWDDEYENKPVKHKMYSRSRRSIYAARDMQEFRHSCKNLDQDGNGDCSYEKGSLINLKFYKGQLKSSPDNIHIDQFADFMGRYDWLEMTNSYIQWMFPLQERGMNWEAEVLTKKEIQLFREDKEAKRKLVKSYEVMLDFYGIRLRNKDTGEVERSSRWKERFDNLNRNTHNNLRITRILKCLGTLGLEHYQAPLVKFFLTETLRNNQLHRVKQSVLDYFIFAVLNKSERKKLVVYAYENFRPKEDFVWGPRTILQKKLSNTRDEVRKTQTSSERMKREGACEKDSRNKEQFFKRNEGKSCTNSQYSSDEDNDNVSSQQYSTTDSGVEILDESKETAKEASVGMNALSQRTLDGSKEASIGMNALSQRTLDGSKEASVGMNALSQRTLDGSKEASVGMNALSQRTLDGSKKAEENDAQVSMDVSDEDNFDRSAKTSEGSLDVYVVSGENTQDGSKETTADQSVGMEVDDRPENAGQESESKSSQLSSRSVNSEKQDTRAYDIGKTQGNKLFGQENKSNL